VSGCDIAARIANEELKNRGGVFLIGKQTVQYKAVIKPAIRHHATILVEGVSFARRTESAKTHDTAELSFGINSQRERTDHLKAIVTDGRRNEHSWNASSQTARIILH
jgi:hypothetical protein